MIPRDGYCKSLWQANSGFEHQHQAAPGNHFDIIIIGGGITGLATALRLQEAGKRCLLLEARQLCFGTTGGTTAHINTLLDTPYYTIIDNFGKEAAIEVCHAAKDALALIKENISRYSIDCGFEEAAAYTYSQDEEQTKTLEKILISTTEAGVVINPVSSIPIPVPFQKAIRAEGQAKFNPVKYVGGLAKAFQSAGGIIMEHCRVESTNEKEPVEVETSRGIFTAEDVIYATHIPPGVNLLHLRCAPWRSYAMAVVLKGNMAIPDLSYDLYDPYRYYRTQTEDGINYLIAGGFDHKTGHEENTERCFAELEAHVRGIFDVESVAYKWSSQYFEPADGIPYIGQLPGHGKHLLVATGFGGNGMTYSHVSAITLSAIILKQESAYIKLFNPGRIKPIAGFKNFVSHNAAVIGQLVGGIFSRQQLNELSNLAKGEGKVVVYDSKKMALYKDEEGNLHALSSTCSHLGCGVSWNNAEQSWDCPCHGARYNADGEVITGPASRGLEKINLEDL